MIVNVLQLKPADANNPVESAQVLCQGRKAWLSLDETTFKLSEDKKSVTFNETEVDFEAKKSSLGIYLVLRPKFTVALSTVAKAKLALVEE